MGTYPDSAYDLEQVLTQLGIGEAIVTVMNERREPTPVAWTRLRAADEAGAQAEKDAAKEARSRSKSSSSRSRSRSSSDDDGGLISDIAGSKQLKDFLRDSGRTLAKEIARGVFKVGRR